MARGRLLPLAALLAYGLAFAWAALGGSLLVADDHPGQLYRLWHVLTRGPAPWAWNAGWWTGYPELQFYPPGFAYAGALLHYATLTSLSVDATYQTLLWIAYLAPGLTTFLVLARLLGNGWLALPGAFVALTFSAGAASGVEGGVHAGMVGARLAWALLPLLLLALIRWVEGGGPLPRLAVPILAAIVLTHPAQLPTAVALVLLAAHVAEPRRERFRAAAGILAVAAALTGFWTVPLLARLPHTRALAWGELTFRAAVDAFMRQPLVPVLLAFAVLVVFARRDLSAPGARTEGVIARLFPVMVAVTLLDRMALEPLGIRWLPADRIVDGAWLALILAAGLGWGRLCRRLVRPAPGALIAIGLTVLLALPGTTLVLWPRAAEWPKLPATERGLRLADLWAAIRRAPEGRVLFPRSGVPLVHGTAWYRLHTHLTALTPMMTGRAIVNGTFTHPSPAAALVYRGDAGRAAITTLVERLDGRSLFGRPLDALDATTFNAYADRLGIGAVVVLDEDLPRLRALEDNAVFGRRVTLPPFTVFERGTGIAIPRETAPGRWQVAASGGGWASARIAYYPLWQARASGTRLPVRRGEWGDLEIQAGRATTVELVYGAALAEKLGLAVSAAGLSAWGALAMRRRAG
ncbi:MAG: hypothetical protein HYU25_09880 [Candidatus Rokubacteria bacterium]|nr:hypothetical protein [Candidatus Rokubacteria bacterium]